MTRIVVSTHGSIDDTELQEILQIMNDCYQRLEPHEALMVNLHVFETFSKMQMFYTAERAKMNISSKEFDEAFVAFHDAWTGVPRISFCLERITNLNFLVKTGTIRHEVGHSILHGEIGDYMFSIPQSYLKAMNDFKFKKDYAINLLYLTSIAVKDYEVTHLLYNRGYGEDQFEYVKNFIKKTEDEKLTWNIIKDQPGLKILHIVSKLKEIFCAIPLLQNNEIKVDLKNNLLESTSYLRKELEIMKVISKTNQIMTEETVQNIDSISELILEEIINPIMGCKKEKKKNKN